MELKASLIWCVENSLGKKLVSHSKQFNIRAIDMLFHSNMIRMALPLNENGFSVTALLSPPVPMYSAETVTLESGIPFQATLSKDALVMCHATDKNNRTT